MLLKDARKLRDEIRAEGLHSVTPTGYGPDSYFARIWGIKGETDFHSRAEWLSYRRGVRQRRAAGLRAAESMRNLDLRRLYSSAVMPKPRSPIELMIDRACGLA